MTQPYGPPPVPGQNPPYPQMQQGQPYAQAPQAPAKKPFYKKAWFIVLAVIVVIAIAANAGGGGSSNDTTAGSSDSSSDGAGADAAQQESAPEESESEESNPGIGEPAADGKFSFVVTGIDCSLTQVGNQYLNKQAQGTFCVVDLTVSNIGDKAQSFFGDNATLLADGKEFSADSEAAIYMDESSSLYEEINPGNSLASKVVFDVPAGTTPTAVELHDSAFSGGVTVSLQ
jgi:hypothetical protein